MSEGAAALLLAGITRKPRTRAGLILGIDATASTRTLLGHCFTTAGRNVSGGRGRGEVWRRSWYISRAVRIRWRVQSVSLDRQRPRCW